MRKRFLLPGLLAGSLVLAGCGSDVRTFLEDNYPRDIPGLGVTNYISEEPVAPTTLRIVEAVSPLARAADAESEYLRYDDHIVVVSPRTPSGSTISVDENLDGPYRRGRYAHLGYGFDPGSPLRGSGGPGDFK